MNIKRGKKLAVCAAGAAVCLAVCLSSAQAKMLSEGLVVGTRHIPPFAMQDEEGRWAGIAIELWEKIADKLNVSYRYEPVSLTEMFTRLQDGTLDAAAAALSITSERESIVDFTHPFYQTGLGIAVARKPAPTWWSVARGLVSWQFARALGMLALLLLIFGFFIWLFERRRNQAQFGGTAPAGIGSGFWWAAVTMTTVGYGDKAPVTFAGRLVALIWMFSGIIVISSITAAITSALTVASLETGIKGPRDLSRAAAGSIRNTTSARYFAERGMHPRLYDTVQQALDDLAKGGIEALVYDAPILAYLINRHYAGKLTVLAQTFEQQQYGIALPFNSRLRQEINRELLLLLENGEFERIKQKYLGG